MDSSWKNLQIRMEAAWNMRTTPKTKRPKTGDIISSAHSLDWNKKKVRQLQQKWNDEVTKLVTDRNKAISDVMVDILTLIRMDIKSASSVLISHDAAKMLWERRMSMVMQMALPMSIVPLRTTKKLSSKL